MRIEPKGNSHELCRGEIPGTFFYLIQKSIKLPMGSFILRYGNSKNGLSHESACRHSVSI